MIYEILQSLQNLKNNKDNHKWSTIVLFILAIFLLMFLLFLVFLFLYYFYIKKDYLSITLIACIIIITTLFNYEYFKSKKNDDKKSLFLGFFTTFLILEFLLTSFLANIWSNMFHIGSYKAKLLINDRFICTFLNKPKTPCTIQTYVIWSYGDFYYIRIRDNIFKIKSQYILLESF